MGLHLSPMASPWTGRNKQQFCNCLLFFLLENAQQCKPSGLLSYQGQFGMTAPCFESWVDSAGGSTCFATVAEVHYGALLLLKAVLCSHKASQPQCRDRHVPQQGAYLPLKA